MFVASTGGVQPKGPLYRPNGATRYKTTITLNHIVGTALASRCDEARRSIMIVAAASTIPAAVCRVRKSYFRKWRFFFLRVCRIDSRSHLAQDSPMDFFAPVALRVTTRSQFVKLKFRQAHTSTHNTIILLLLLLLSRSPAGEHKTEAPINMRSGERGNRTRAVFSRLTALSVNIRTIGYCC